MLDQKPAKTPKLKILEFPPENRILSRLVLEELKELSFPINKDLVCSVSDAYCLSPASKAANLSAL